VANEKTSGGAGGGSERRGEGRGGRGPTFGDRGRGPGGGGPGGPGGRGPGGPRGRGDRRGDRGRDERRGEFGGASHRILSELPALEKALSAADLSKQKTTLEQILKALRPMRLKSLEDLDANTRGRLLTTLVRVQRQARPANLEELAARKSPAPPPAEPAPPATGSAAEAAPPDTAADGVPGDAAAQSAEPDSGVAAAETVEHAADEVSEVAAPSDETAAPAPPTEEGAEVGKAHAYQEVLFLAGQVWRAAGERDRAQAAFELSGRPPPARDEPVEAVAREKPERRDRPPRGERGPRPPQPAPAAAPNEGRRERAVRSAHRATEPVNLPIGGNWQEVAADYENQGRTRDAARVHERNQSWAEAARLFELGANPREALRCAIAARDGDAARRLARSIPLDQARTALEKANAFEILMELYVHAQDFENVAKLYERARQFDQAGLAWERSGKFAAARKAYERARDFKAATRMRNMEVDKLVERGDRLGAAQILVQAGRKQEAVAVLLALPPFKAYKFLERLKLDEAAKALAGRELLKSTEEKKIASRARWLELLDDNAQAAQAWAEASRPDRASVCNEKAGNLGLAAEQAEAVQDYDRAQDLYRRAGDAANMERVATLPRVSLEERKKRHPPMHEDEHDHDDGLPPDQA
jgi:hypothetical protein